MIMLILCVQGVLSSCPGECFFLSSNKRCDEHCNIEVCGFDNFDCEFSTDCAEGCTEELKNNDSCELACSVSACDFDNYHCLPLCGPGCGSSQIGDGVCDVACFTLACSFDGGDCENCTAGCSLAMVNNGTCEEDCIDPACDFDGSDCKATETLDLSSPILSPSHTLLELLVPSGDLTQNIELTGSSYLILRGECPGCSTLKIKGGFHGVSLTGFKKVWIFDLEFDGLGMWAEDCSDFTCAFFQKWECSLSTNECTTCREYSIPITSSIIHRLEDENYCDYEFDYMLLDVVSSGLFVDNLTVRNLDAVSHIIQVTANHAHFSNVKLENSVLFYEMIQASMADTRTLDNRFYVKHGNQTNDIACILGFPSEELKVTNVTVKDVNNFGCLGDNFCRDDTSPGILDAVNYSRVYIENVHVSNLWDRNNLYAEDTKAYIRIRDSSLIRIFNLTVESSYMKEKGLVDISKMNYFLKDLIDDEYHIEIDTVNVHNVFMYGKSGLINIRSSMLPPYAIIKNIFVSDFASTEGGIVHQEYEISDFFSINGTSSFVIESSEGHSFPYKHWDLELKDIFIQNSKLSQNSIKFIGAKNFDIHSLVVKNCSNAYNPSILDTLSYYDPQVTSHEPLTDRQDCQSIFYMEEVMFSKLHSVSIDISECERIFDLKNLNNTELSDIAIESSEAVDFFVFESANSSNLLKNLSFSHLAIGNSGLKLLGDHELTLEHSVFTGLPNRAIANGMTSLLVKDCTFTENYPSQSLIWNESKESDLYVVDCVFVNNESDNPSDFYFAETGLATIINSVFAESTGNTPIIIGFNKRAEFSRILFQDCQFSNFTVDYYTGIIAPSFLKGTLSFESCSFFNIQAGPGKTASIIFSDIGEISNLYRPILELSNCLFYANQNIVLISQESRFIVQYLEVRNSHFQQNINCQVFSLANSIATIENSEISYNQINNTPLITASRNSQVVLDHVAIDHNTEIQRGKLLLFTDGSSIFITNSQISQNNAQFSDILVHENVDLNIANCEIYSNLCIKILSLFQVTADISHLHTDSNECEIVLSADSSSLNATSIYVSREEKAMYFYYSDVKVVSSTLYEANTGIHSQDSDIQIEDSSLEQCRVPLLSLSSNLTILSSIFSRYEQSPIIQFSDIVFNDVSIQSGLSEFSIEDSSLTLDQGLIQSSRSLSLLNTTTQISNLQVSGNIDSSLKLNSSILDLSSFTCNYNTADSGACLHLFETTAHIKDSEITFNTAARGGGVYHENSQVSIENTVFANNSAIHGEDAATNPVSLQLAEPLAMPLKSGGVVSNITVYLLDEYGQLAATEEAVIGKLLPEEETLLTGETESSSVSGVIVFSDIMLYQTPLTNSTLKIWSEKTPQIELLLEFRDCEAGEILMPDSSCFLCGNNTFSLYTDDLYCAPCPPEAVCEGGNSIYPKEGYWRPDPEKAIFYLCPNQEACLGGESEKGKCNDGYMGNLCAVCAESHRPGSGYKCSLCPSTAVSYLLVGVAVLLIIGFVVVMVVMKLKGAKKKPSDVPLYVKMLVNYLQTVMLFSGFNISWPGLIGSFINVSSVAGNPSSEIASMRCSKTNLFSGLETHLQEMILLNLSPLILCVLSLGIWVGVAWKKRDNSYIRVHFVATVVILVFFLHSAVTSSLLSLYGCQEIDGKYWMTADYSIECWSGSHKKMSVYLGVPGLVVWCFVIPLVVFKLLQRNKDKFEEENVQVKYKTLYGGYREDYFFWELIVLYRKLLIKAVAVALVNFPVVVQGMAAVVVLCTMGYLQMSFSPYQKEKINKLEFLSITTCAFTLVCGIFYDERLGTGFETAISYLVMIINVLYITTWGYFLWVAVLEAGKNNKVIVKINEKIKKIGEKISSSISNLSNIPDKRGSTSRSASVAPFDSEFECDRIEIPVNNTQFLEPPSNINSESNGDFTLR